MVNLNLEICELVGAFIGDGYLSASTGKYGVLGFAGNGILDKDYFNHLLYLINRNFPTVSCSLRFRKDENTVMLRSYSLELISFFRDLGFRPGLKSRIVMIPSDIVRDQSFMNAAIRGIFDTDGCLFFDCRKAYTKPYPRIVLQVASIHLIEQLENHLSKNFSLYVDKTNRDGKRNSIEIYGHLQLERFLKRVGFSNKRHLSKLPL